jgi:hypothetical protein
MLLEMIAVMVAILFAGNSTGVTIGMGRRIGPTQFLASGSVFRLLDTISLPHDS